MNYSGLMASSIMTLSKAANSKNEEQKNNMGTDAGMEARHSLDVLKERYKEATCFTTGNVFGVGDGRSGTEAEKKVIRRVQGQRGKGRGDYGQKNCGY